MLNLIDKLTDPPSGGEPQKWLAGAVLPSLISLYGLSCVLSGYAKILVFELYGRHGYGPAKFVTLDGAILAWYCVFIFGVAAYCHFQWYWGNDKRLVYYFEPFRFAALLTVAISVCVAAWLAIFYT